MKTILFPFILAILSACSPFAIESEEIIAEKVAEGVIEAENPNQKVQLVPK